MAHWWNRTGKQQDEPSSAPPPPPRAETDREMWERLRHEEAVKDRQAARAREYQERRDEAALARRDAVHREWVMRTMVRNGTYFPGDSPSGLRGSGILQAFRDPGLREYQASLQDLWDAKEREHYQEHQWDDPQ